MANLPSSKVTISAEAGALAGGTGYCVIFSCVEKNPDLTPRVYSSWKAINDQHGYAQGEDYAAIHLEETGQQVIFIGLPTATAGALGRVNSTGVAGTSAISVTPGNAGYLEETFGILTVTAGGTVGTSGIMLTLSLDGGVTTKSIRLGSNTSYTVPYLGIVINFGAGTLLTGDTFKFTTTAPMWDGDGISAAVAALVAQQKPARSWLIAEEISTNTQAGFITTAANAYETEDERFTLARVNVRDRLPLASKSSITKRMSGAPTLTFVNVGSSGDTITRNAGSFIDEGWAVGDTFAVTGSASNNVSGQIASLTATVITLGTSPGLAAEGPVSGCSIMGSDTLTFASSGKTIARTAGSWLDDGFAVGDSGTITGTASNNLTSPVTAVTATVLTMAGATMVNETVASNAVTIVKGETMSAWISANELVFETVDDEERIDIAIGRLRRESPITGWNFRRPVSWAASSREYQHDIHITTWRKEYGPLQDWSMLDANGQAVEYDERAIGGALAARFTCARTWANGPEGPFIAMSLTRATEDTPLELTQNMYVTNVACTVVQSSTENFIGRTPQLDANGFMLATERQKLEVAVNADLSTALLQEHVPGEGPRASSAVWTAATNDDLRGPDGTVNGVLALETNGTIVNVNTQVQVS